MDIGFSPADVISNVNAPRQKNTLQESMVNDERFDKMTFQVLDLAEYHNNEKKLMEDIKAFQPTLLSIAFCFSLYSDVTRVLRQCGVSAEMVITQDIRKCFSLSDARHFAKCFQCTNSFIQH